MRRINNTYMTFTGKPEQQILETGIPLNCEKCQLYILFTASKQMLLRRS
jgi:hypothetical protein